MIKVIGLLILLAGLSSCSTIEVPTDIFVLDQSFIAVWLPTQKCELEKAAKNYSWFKEDWYIFKKKYKDQLKTANQKETARLLEQWLEEAGQCLAQQDAICAQVKLDQFKFQMQEIRSYWISDYYIDFIWNFEEDLNRFIEIGMDPKLDLLEWNEFMPYLQAINSSFDKLNKAELDPEFLDFDPDKLGRWAQMKKDIEGRLTCLNGLTEGAQLEEIVDCAIGIQESTYEAIALFGNIEYTPEIIF